MSFDLLIILTMSWIVNMLNVREEIKTLHARISGVSHFIVILNDIWIVSIVINLRSIIDMYLNRSNKQWSHFSYYYKTLGQLHTNSMLKISNISVHLEQVVNFSMLKITHISVHLEQFVHSSMLKISNISVHLEQVSHFSMLKISNIAVHLE